MPPKQSLPVNRLCCLVQPTSPQLGAMLGSSNFSNKKAHFLINIKILQSQLNVLKQHSARNRAKGSGCGPDGLAKIAFGPRAFGLGPGPVASLFLSFCAMQIKKDAINQSPDSRVDI